MQNNVLKKQMRERRTEAPQSPHKRRNITRIVSINKLDPRIHFKMTLGKQFWVLMNKDQKEELWLPVVVDELIKHGARVRTLETTLSPADYWSVFNGASHVTLYDEQKEKHINAMAIRNTYDELSFYLDIYIFDEAYDTFRYREKLPPGIGQIIEDYALDADIKYYQNPVFDIIHANSRIVSILPNATSIDEKTENQAHYFSQHVFDWLQPTWRYSEKYPMDKMMEARKDLQNNGMDSNNIAYYVSEYPELFILHGDVDPSTNAYHKVLLIFSLNLYLLNGDYRAMDYFRLHILNLSIPYRPYNSILDSIKTIM